MVITQAGSPAVQDAAKAHAEDLGVRIAMQHDNKTGNYLQFHPADTGGAFFELDWDSVNDPTGHWPPADGDGWQDKINRTIIGDLVGVELQGDDPAALADKWSALTGLALEPRAGIPTLGFANAGLGFVKATAGRGDGLGGLDVTCTDPSAAIAAAKRNRYFCPSLKFAGLFSTQKTSFKPTILSSFKACKKSPSIQSITVLSLANSI